MFDKRLLSLVPGVVPPIVRSVLAKWVALLCNIVVMTLIGAVFGMFLEPRAGFNVLGAVLSGNGAEPLAVLLNMEVWDGLTVTAALAGIAAVLVARAVAIALAQRFGDRAAYRAKREIRQLVYDKLSGMGPAYAETVSTAEAVQTSVERAQQLEVYFGGYLPQLFYAVLAPVTLFALLVGLAGLPAAILLAMVPLIPVSIMAVMRNAKKVAAEYWDTYVDLGGSFLEAMQGLTTLKIYRADARWHERMNEEAEGFRRATMKMLGVQLRSITVMDLVAFGGAAMGIAVAALQLASGAIGFTGAFLVVFLSQEFFLPMRRLGSLFHTAMNGTSAAKTMFAILDAPASERGEALLDGAADIRCKGVGYAYGEKTVLAGVDCTIPRGSFTAVVGASGSGKSTLAGVLSGRKAGYRGRLEIGGIDVREASAASLMDTVTLVPTNGYLFEGTIRSNLAMAVPDAADSELWDALDRCCIADFARANGGLDMAVAEGGTNLSGGQRQRICVARALLHDAPVYVFDEATSNVDVESERAIGRVIEDLAGEHTVIVIAHRLASVVGADQILVIDHGSLVEQGTHDELLAQNGAYAALWTSQSELSDYVAKQEPLTFPQLTPSESSAAITTPSSQVDFSASEGGEGFESSGDTFPSDSAGAKRRGPAKEIISGASHGHRSAFSIMFRMVGLVRPLAPYLALAVVLGSIGSLAATFLTTFGAYALMAAIDLPLSLTVVSASMLVILCGIVRGPLHYGEQLCNHYIAFRLLALIRDRVFSALRRLAPAKLEGRDKGDLVSLVTADIELLEVFYAHTISPIAIALVTSAVMIAFIGWHAPALAVLALVAYTLLGVALPIASSKLCGEAGRASRDQAGAISSFVLESLRGLSETIQYGRTSDRSAGLADRTAVAGAVDARLHRRSAAVEGVSDALVLAFSVTMMIVSLALVLAGKLSYPAAFACTFAFFSSFGPVLAVCRLGTSLQATIASGARVLDLLDEEPETAEISDGADVAFAGAEADHVGFGYAATGERILDDLSLSFPEGEMACITGRSGSGKSTLLKLLMRFWDVTEGAVRVSGHDVREVNTASLRAIEGYMTQDTHLFVGTIGDNLRIARADATDSELDEACAAAALTDLIDRLPAGYDTPVGELGDSLSGGERQRIGLARIFLHDAPFVLLDEPTSNLDALSEAAVMRAVAERRAGKTVVLVSHRASTCAFADKFYSVEQGRLS